MNAIDQVITLEKEALNGWSGGNAAAYGMHAHPDSIYFDNLGARNQIAGEENIKKYAATAFAELKPHNYELIGLRARQFGDTVILSYRYHPIMPDGAPSMDWGATIVYASFDGDWKSVHASWTALMDLPAQ